MKRTTGFLVFITACSASHNSPKEKPTPKTEQPALEYSVQSIHRRIQRVPDAAKYPVPIEESYELTSNGGLRYSAYFGNMPISMNHNDSITWDAASHGEKVLQVLTAMVRDQALLAQLQPATTSACSAKGFDIGVARDSKDSNLCVMPPSEAFLQLDAVFSDLIVAFETVNGRPLTPSTLPQ